MRPYCSILLLAVLLLPTPALGKPLVMVVNSYHQTHPWVQAHNGELSIRLHDKAELRFLYLDTKRLPVKEHQASADKAWEVISAAHPDVVVLTDDNAVKFLGRRSMDVNIPVVFLGVNENPRKYLGNMEMATGVLERPLYKRSLLFLQEIMGPSLRRCLMLFDSSDTSEVIMETIFKGRRMVRLGHTTTVVRLLDTFEQWQDSIENVAAEEFDVVFVGLYHTLVNDQGVHAPSEEVLRWTSAHSPAPIFGFWDFTVGKGMAVGGLVNSGVPQGRAAADLVLKVLAGQSPGTLYPVTPKDGQFLFSRHELMRWNIILPDNLARAGESIFYVP